jgi:hypothetical protein
MPPRFSQNIDLTLGVNAPLMSYVITVIHQFIIIEVVEFEKLHIHGTYYFMDFWKKLIIYLFLNGFM